MLSFHHYHRLWQRIQKTMAEVQYEGVEQGGGRGTIASRWKKVLKKHTWHGYLFLVSIDVLAGQEAAPPKRNFAQI